MNSRFDQRGRTTVTRLPPRLPAAQFWGLAFVTFLILQVPVLRVPIRFLSTWAHEMGHGLGAIMVGGAFEEFVVTERFGGVAITRTFEGLSRSWVMIVGLLGPAILGALTIVMVRALNWYRVATGLLTLSLLVTQIWAGDLFTRGVLAACALAFGLATWKLPNRPLMIVAHIVALAFCLDSLTGFGYFFMDRADIGGVVIESDISQLAAILGGPHWMWGALLVGVSVLITVGSVLLSDRWARAHEAPVEARLVAPPRI